MAKLHFYYSAMNAGKTTTLLQSEFNYRERGMETLLFVPNIDDRYGVGKVTSRIGLDADAIPVSSTDNLFDYTKNVLASGQKISCVFVDEAQFLKKAQVLQLTDIVDFLNIPVLAYGLRSDFKGEPFEGSLYLLTLAEQLMEIKTICHCGSKAIMNSKINGDGSVVRDGTQIEIGGNSRYLATCRKHFKEGKVA